MRAIALLLGFVLPPLLIGASLARLPGAAAGASLGAAVFAYCAWTWRRAMFRVMGPIHPANPGLIASLKRVAIEELALETSPEILESSSPQSNAWILAERGGHSTLVLTRGLLAALSEPELRAVLRRLALRARSPRVPFQTLCASIAIRILGLAPSEWVAFAFLGRPITAGSHAAQSAAFRFMRFLIVYPWARMVMRAGEDAPKDPIPTAVDPTWDTALRKIKSSAYSSDFIGHPALGPLYLCPPRPLSEALRLGR